MIRSISLSMVCAAAAFGASAQAQQAPREKPPLFNARMVHPLGEQQQGDPSAQDAPGRPVDRRPVPVGKTPRTHADEVAGVFQRACLDVRGDASAAADWALTHGFVAASDTTQEQAADALESDQPANVFARESDPRSVLLMSVSQPLRCSVLARRPVEPARLRGHVERMASVWAGGRAAPEPVVDMRMLQGDPLRPSRMLGYKFVVGGKVHSLVMTAPEKAGDGVAFVALMVTDAAGAATEGR